MNAVPFQVVPLSDVERHPGNPRKHFDQTALNDLAQSIAKVGIIQPLTVRANPTQKERAHAAPWQLVAGESRLRAAKMAGLEEVPVVVKDLTDREVLELQITENLQRRSLSALEEAKAIEALTVFHQVSREDAAAILGKSISYIHRRLALCLLGHEGQKLLEGGYIGLGHAEQLCRISSKQARDEAELELSKLSIAMEEQEKRRAKADKDYKLDLRLQDWSVQQVIRSATRSLENAPFDVKDATLPGGACGTCPKRSSCQTQLNIAGIEQLRGDTCTDAACFEAKKVEAWNRTKAKAEAKGLEVIEGKAAEKLNFYGGGEFVSLDSYNYSSDESKTYKQLLKTELKSGAIKPIVVQGVGEVIRKADLKKVAPELSKGTGGNDWQQKRARELEKAKRRNAIGRTLIAEQARQGLNALDAKLICFILFEARGGGEVVEALAKHLAPDAKDPHAALARLLRTPPEPDETDVLWSRAAAEALLSMPGVATYSGEWSDFAKVLADLQKADLQALEAEAKKTSRKPAKGKAKAKTTTPHQASDQSGCNVADCKRPFSGWGMCKKHLQVAKNLGLTEPPNAEQLVWVAQGKKVEVQTGELVTQPRAKASKSKASSFRCNQCQATSPKWMGKCPGCGAWSTLIEEGAQPATPDVSVEGCAVDGCGKAVAVRPFAAPGAPRPGYCHDHLPAAREKAAETAADVEASRCTGCQVLPDVAVSRGLTFDLGRKLCSLCIEREEQDKATAANKKTSKKAKASKSKEVANG